MPTHPVPVPGPVPLVPGLAPVKVLGLGRVPVPALVAVASDSPAATLLLAPTSESDPLFDPKCSA